mgnify:CR=1 FL=1
MSAITGMKDADVINFLRKDARMQFSELSRLTGKPITTIFTRSKNYPILRFTSLMDFEELGYFIRVLLISGRPPEDNVNTLVRTDDGFMAECLFRNFSELAEIKKKFGGRVLFIEPLIQESFRL